MKVSICIPTYNQDRYIEMAIRSAVAQTVSPFEIIVSNDLSTDGSREILDKLEREILNLRVIHQPINLGIAKNVDFCLRQASGDFIIRLDSDDNLAPLYTETLIEQMKLFPNAGYAHTAVQEIDQDNNPTRIRRLARKSGFQNADEALKLAVNGYRVSANILMFRRAALKKVNYITTNVNFAEDYFMVSAISAAGYGNVYVSDVLCNYRAWVDKNKIRTKRKDVEIKGLIQVFDIILAPAFKERNWDMSPIEKSRVTNARNHASCLGWDIYSDSEKIELTKLIFQLAGTKAPSFHVWAYTNGFGFLFMYGKSINYFKSFIKKYLYK